MSLEYYEETLLQTPRTHTAAAGAQSMQPSPLSYNNSALLLHLLTLSVWPPPLRQAELCGTVPLPPCSQEWWVRHGAASTAPSHLRVPRCPATAAALAETPLK